VIAPARKARTGRIGLRPSGDGFATPAFEDGSRILVRGDRLAWDPGGDTTLTTVRAAAQWLAVDLSPDPGVGQDLPPFRPDDLLSVDIDGSLALGHWYALGGRVLADLGQQLRPSDSMTEAQIWPEHFDLATVVTLAGEVKANVGFSPGDSFEAEPYTYVGPFDRAGLSGDYWNAPFGAYRPRSDQADALEFVRSGLDRMRDAVG
jgi:hypothetical protein